MENAYNYDDDEFKKHDDEPPAVEICPPSHILIADEFFENQGGQVYIKTLGGRVIQIAADPGDLIETIKEKIRARAGISVNEQNLLYAGQKLRDDRSLSDYNIRHGATIHLLLGDEDPMQMILESQSALQEGQFEMNVLYQNETYPLKMKEVQTVKDLKVMIANTIIRVPKDILLLYGGKLLLDDEKDLVKAGILNNSNIVVIPALDGGDCLRFTQLVLETMIKDLPYLKSSLQSLVDDVKKLERFLTLKKEKAKNLKTKAELKDVSEEGLVSIMLWTSNLLYKKLNKILRDSEDFSKWKVYLKNLLNGLKAMPYHRGKIYRGLKDLEEKDLKPYKKGENIIWKTISGLSKKPEVAKRFSNAKGVIFEVEVYSSRDISSLSEYTEEEEVLMLPYSCFEVVDVIKKENEPVYIKLKEIPTPRAPNVIFWTDDQPEGNHVIAKEVEQRDISCVFCVSTNDALKVIEKYRWLLYFENADFKIVTDMVRYEDGVANYTAGVDIVEKLVKDFQYNFEILIFCGDVKRAQQNCDARKLKGRFSITSSQRELRKFLNFNKNEKGGF